MNRWFLLALALAGCAAEDTAPHANGGGAPDGGLGACATSAQCPTGLVCQDRRCVTPEGLPPEQEQARTFLRPEAAGRHLFVLSPDSDTVTVIDTLTLAVRSLVVPDEPIALAALPGRGAVAILSRQGAALSLLDTGDGMLRLSVQAVPRRYDALAVSPDGRRAVLWTPEGTRPESGAEGIVAIADLAALEAGAPAPVVERAAGRRHTDVFFRVSGGEAVEAVVVGKQEIAVLDLVRPAQQPVPDRLALPDEWAEIVTREAAAPPGGDYVLLRSATMPAVAVFRVASRTLQALPLPAPASDLDLSADGAFAVAVLRAASKTAWFPLPGVLTNPSLVRTAEVSLPGTDCGDGPCAVAPGQAELAPDRSFALLFTDAVHTESFARLDLGTGVAAVHDRLNKLVRTLGVSADGKTAIVLHRADPSSTLADTYERRVDRSEGYSVVDLATGDAQLKLTDDVPPTQFLFAADGRHAAVVLRRDAGRAWRVDAIDLATLVTGQTPLASAPLFAGALPGADGRVWVTQEHPAGRISFVDLADRGVRTVTGYDLNSEIESCDQN